jgi:dTDP-4-dehydrorhamnose reductase
MSKSKNILVLGASGLLGRRVLAALNQDIAVGTFCTRPFDRGVFFDATKMRLRDKFLRNGHDFRAAFILLGSTNLDNCAKNPTDTGKINVEAVKRAIDDLTLEGVKPIFASSDAVFNGSLGLRTELDPTDPILSYGKQKLEVEKYIAAQPGNWVIARLSKLVSSVSEPRNLLSEWATELEQGQTILCASELIFSPADVDDVTKALICLAEDRFTGLFHACGPAPIRRLELLNYLARKLGEHTNLKGKIKTCTLQDLTLAETRPVDQSMDATKLYSSLGFSFRKMEDLCLEFVSKRYALNLPPIAKN